MIRKCSRFVLSDFSAGMLQTAREALKDIEDIEYQVIDIQNIPFPDDSFDIVIANMMLYHVPDLKQGLRKVRRDGPVRYYFIHGGWKATEYQGTYIKFAFCFPEKEHWNDTEGV